MQATAQLVSSCSANVATCRKYITGSHICMCLSFGINTQECRSQKPTSLYHNHEALNCKCRWQNNNHNNNNKLLIVIEQCCHCICNVLDGVCDPVPIIDHAFPNSSLATNGSVIVYQCQTGFAFDVGLVTSSTTCNGVEWSTTPEACTSREKKV